MALTKEQIKEIRIEDLEEAFHEISKSDSENIWFKELTAIDNAIKFIREEK